MTALLDARLRRAACRAGGSAALRLLADRLAATGCRVLPVWVTAPVEETLQRLAERRGPTVPVTVEEARWIHAEATRRAAGRSFTAIVDTSGPPDPGRLRPLATLLR